jgi:hypothetical protein
MAKTVTEDERRRLPRRGLLSISHRLTMRRMP